MNARLLLVDAFNILYRSYFAIRNLSNATGQPTNALFGFIKSLRQLERTWQPTHWLVAFDGGLPPERLQICPEYKAQRAPMPDALRQQMEPVLEYLDAAGVTHARMAGKEADDLMASAAWRAVREGCEVLIVSGDKDLMQVVAEQIAIVSPGKAMAKIGPQEVMRQTGVHPTQIVDWLALTGDSADNIAGVAGVGAKTAAKLLNQWRNVAGIYEHIEAVHPEKTRQALRDGEKNVRRNLQLIKLETDLAVWEELETLRRHPADNPRLQSFYQEYGFHSLMSAPLEQGVFDFR